MTRLFAPTCSSVRLQDLRLLLWTPVVSVVLNSRQLWHKLLADTQTHASGKKQTLVKTITTSHHHHALLRIQKCSEKPGSLLWRVRWVSKHLLKDCFVCITQTWGGRHNCMFKSSQFLGGISYQVFKDGVIWREGPLSLKYGWIKSTPAKTPQRAD